MTKHKQKGRRFMSIDYDLIERNKELFQEFEENGKFEDIENPLSRSELTHAFLVFERVLGDDMPKLAIGGTEHDVIFVLEHDAGELFFQRATEQDLKEVACCGIFLSEEFDSLCSFV
jgi:hypothetical protein